MTRFEFDECPYQARRPPFCGCFEAFLVTMVKLLRDDGHDIAPYGLGRGQSEHLLGGSIPVDDLGAVVGGHDRMRRGRNDLGGDLAAQSAPPRLEQLGCQCREIAQPVEFLDGEIGMRHSIERTQAADTLARVEHQRRAGVEPEPGMSGDQRVGGELFGLERIRDQQRLAASHHLIAKGDIARRFPDLDPVRGLEPLAIGIDQADPGIGYAHDRGCNPRECVELALGLGVEHAQLAQRSQAQLFRFRIGDGRRIHPLAIDRRRLSTRLQ